MKKTERLIRPPYRVPLKFCYLAGWRPRCRKQNCVADGPWHPTMVIAAAPGEIGFRPDPPGTLSQESDFPKLLSVTDLMTIFGRSEATMRRWVGTRIPEIKIGRSVFVCAFR
jgi:hypothetical protein